MRRPLAHLFAAGSTILVLEGLSFGFAIGLSAVEPGSESPHVWSWQHVAATTVWVVALLAPVAAWLAPRRERVGWAALVVGLVAAGARLVLDWSSGAASAVRWSFADGVGLALGLLVYDLIYGTLSARAAE